MASNELTKFIYITPSPYLDTLQHAINDSLDRLLVREVQFEYTNSYKTRNSTIAFDRIGQLQHVDIEMNFDKPLQKELER